MKPLLLSLAILAALSGCGAAPGQQEHPAVASAAPAPSVGSATPAGPITARPLERSPSPSRPPVVPTRLRLGDIVAPVVPIELDGTALTPPPDPEVLGWWGRRAGARQGTTLLTGHTVHAGGGTFDDLELTSVGERAHLNGFTYRVRSVKVISKDELARRAPRLFSQTGRHRLVLVTCEDYDAATGHYASNVVVVLEPVE